MKAPGLRTYAVSMYTRTRPDIPSGRRHDVGAGGSTFPRCPCSRPTSHQWELVWSTSSRTNAKLAVLSLLSEVLLHILDFTV